MDPKMRAIVDGIKAQVVEQVKKIRAMNKTVPVSGTRHILPLEGRTLDMVYYPAERENAPLLLGFHGGGFLFGGCALDDAMWDTMRKQLNVNIASIDYRKTPEFQCPAPVEDAYDSAIYLKTHSAEFGFDPEHISVFGSSAGANISAAVCILAKERGGVSFDYQIMNYPAVDNATDMGKKEEGSLDAPINYVFFELYVKPNQERDPLCSPIYATKEQLTGLPTAIIRMADFDSFKTEGFQYAEQLRAAGVTVYTDLAVGMPHGYFEYGFGTGMGQDFLDEGIKKQIEDGSIAKEAQKGLDFIKAHYV